MKFIGRNNELERLTAAFSSPGMNVSLIYGRRRVGKSELVKEALRLSKAKYVYYECRQVAEMSNVAGLSDALSEMMGLPSLAFRDLETLFRYIYGLAKDEKVILVLDEYPYLREKAEGMDSRLKALIDECSGKSRLSLVLLGSYIDTMKEILVHDNPLYGRVDLVIDLKPMDYRDASLFYPAYSPEDKARVYSVFGGIPYYNRRIDDSLSVKENIVSLIASSGAPLENEVPGFLGSQLSKIENANEVFLALAKGYCRYSDILSQSHVSSSPTLADTLEKLVGMEVVRKEAPINDEGNKRKVLYRISDRLSSFYYRYIYPRLSSLAIMDGEEFFSRYIEKDFEEHFVPHAFEEICKQYLVGKNREKGIFPVIEKIGKYYYDDPKEKKNGEFDIVTLDEKGYVFYEVKFSKNVLSSSAVNEEIAQIEATGFKPYKYVFFLRNGHGDPPSEKVEFIPIEALYG